MLDFQQFLYDHIAPILAGWEDPGIYAVSFFVYVNEAFTYGEYRNISCFHISYNTEEACGSVPADSEERWNYAYWPQDAKGIIDPDTEGDAGTRVLLDWYAQQGMENVGFEDDASMYDENMNYVGKGPVGYYELLTAASNVARRIQQEGLLTEKFGKPIPILVHDLEYAWYVGEATRNANPNGEAADFLSWMEGMEGGDF